MMSAAKISYLTEEQKMLLTAMDSEQATPSLSQTQQMKKLSREGGLNDDSMPDIMMELKSLEKATSPSPVKSYGNTFRVLTPHFKLKTPSLSSWTHGRRSTSVTRADKRTSSLFVRCFYARKEVPMYINTFKYPPPKDVSCKLCTEYVKKLGYTSSQSLLISVSADGENCAHSLAPPLSIKSAALRGPRTCPWLAERIETSVVGYREVVLKTFPNERRLFQRLNLLIKHYPGSLWSNEQHERRTTAAAGTPTPTMRPCIC